VRAGYNSATGMAAGLSLGSFGIAYAERSPTHLHLMVLRAADMTPVNPYLLLHNLPQPPTGSRLKWTATALAPRP
jgi:hypothetical protein